MQLLLMPPPQCDHPYSGQVIEQRLSQAELMRLCRGPAEGCASVSNGVCHIALPMSEKDAHVLAAMRHHELAHCNGWPANHSGGHWVDLDPPQGGDRLSLRPYAAEIVLKPRPRFFCAALFQRLRGKRVGDLFCQRQR